MKLHETVKSKLTYLIIIQTTTPYNNNIQDSDNDLAEKLTQNVNIFEKNPNFKGKVSFKK